MTAEGSAPTSSERAGSGERGFDQRFTGKVAVVTGASRGIGLAIARRLRSEGARVVITARKPAELNEAARSLGGDDHVVAVAGSSADPTHRAEATRAAVDRFGGLHILVNNAGINPLFGPMLQADPAAAAKIFETNLLASLGWVRDACDAGLGSAGAVVNIASAAGLRPAEGLGLYGASKAAVIHMTEQLAVELAPLVRVNAVAPAVVRTRFAGALYEGREAHVSARYPLATLGAPEDVAAAVAFLASDEAGWITGQTLTLDGGLLLTGGV